MKAMKLLFATSECAPFAKTGGLGDVAYALPKEIARHKDIDIRVVLPFYTQMPSKYQEQVKDLTHFRFQLGNKNAYCGIKTLKLDGVVYYFIDNLAYDMLNIAYESTTKKEHFVVNVKNDNYIYTVLSYDFYDVEVITRRNDNLSIKDLNTNMVDFLNSFIKSVIDNTSSFVESENDLTKDNKIDKEIFETLATKVQDSFVNLWYKRN